MILDRPEVQEVVSHCLQALSQWCAPLRKSTQLRVEPHATRCSPLRPISPPNALRSNVLASVDEEAVRPIFIKTTIRSLMRRKIEPIVKPLLAQIGVLRKRIRSKQYVSRSLIGTYERNITAVQ